ncbi:MAG: hypothetical protein NZ893_03435, partial [Candidatus Aenigmarchaeota archaeon]|nr:hypothetical protein [Candidatus Aenigmarchaeota archaeon]
TSKANFIHIKKVSNFLSTNSNTPESLGIKDFNNGVFMERDKKNSQHSTKTPQRNSLKDKDYGMCGVLETKNPNFLMDDWSNFNPDEIEILEDDEVEG